jgi:hypothetical protein
MTTKAKIFRVCVGLEYLTFIGLIVEGILESDAFNPRLLIPITLIGIGCAINTWGILERSGGLREDDSSTGQMPVRRSTVSRPVAPRDRSSSDTRNNR